MAQLVQIIFSWDRPLQLWGLVKSMLDNTDLKPQQIQCLCKCSDVGYQRLYRTVGKELGCQIVYQDDKSLWNLLWKQIQDNEFVGLLVDDMVFFRKALYNDATKIMQEESEICIWSWCVGPDLWTSAKMRLHERHWTTPHAVAYGYIFHENGSLYRKKNLKYWLQLIPKKYRAVFNLNRIEGYLSLITKSAGQQLGSLHAGPLLQACTTWRVNSASNPRKKSSYYGIAQTELSYLGKIFEAGSRLDYSPLYERVDWLRRLNKGQSNFAHIVASRAATNLFRTLIKT